MSVHQTTGRKLERYAELLEVGQIITSEINFDTLFPLVIQHTNSIMDTEASSIFLFDENTKDLYFLVSTDLKKSKIRIPVSHGVAGWVFQNKTFSVVNDPLCDLQFDAGVDEKTGFHTRNMLCVPLINRQKECIGTLQALNKRVGGFGDDDVEVLTSLSNYATVALENSRLYEDLKAMNKAKERAISHLSHELKTPLALISAILTTVSAKLVSSNIEGIEGNVAMVQRNLDRLLRLQQEIDNIMNENAAEYRARISRLVEDAFHFVEYQRGVERGTYGEVLGLLSDYIGSIYKVDEESSERLSAHKFLRAVCQDGRTDMADRQVEIAENMIEGQTITANRSVLEKVFDGILRNAVENTPDEGRIEVTTQVDCDRLVVQFRDFGTGITPENQNLIFTGFFHTQDTDQYSTKTPYAFNAGGSGADLLRAKVFSERYGFTIDFESTRCAFIPKDTDECPGRISLCKFIADESGCHASGTVFTVSIPLSEER